MNRSITLVSLVAAACAAAAIAFWLQSRSLKGDLAEARVARSVTPPPAPADPGVPKKELEAANVRSSELERKVTELETKLAEAEKKAAANKGGEVKKDPVKTDGAAPGELSEEMKGVLAKMGKTLRHGAEIPDGAVKDLGLDEVQKAAVRRAMEAEEKRLDESMQRFYAEQVDPNASGTYDKTAQELILSMMGKMAPDLQDLGKLPPEESQKIHFTSSIEELLGPDKFLSKLAREIHAVRLKTYDDLAMALTPEQVGKMKDTYLREGSMYFKDMPLEFGLAPKEMRK